MSNMLRGEQVPEFLRQRGIRWIMPKGVRLNFEREQKLRDEGFVAGFSAARSGRDLAESLAAYRSPQFEKHCRKLGFTAAELESIEEPK